MRIRNENCRKTKKVGEAWMENIFEEAQNKLRTPLTQEPLNINSVRCNTVSYKHGEAMTVNDEKVTK